MATIRRHPVSKFLSLGFVVNRCALPLLPVGSGSINRHRATLAVFGVNDFSGGDCFAALPRDEGIGVSVHLLQGTGVDRRIALHRVQLPITLAGPLILAL